MKKNKLTAEEHIQLGRDLQETRNWLIDAVIKVKNSYPQTSKAYKKADAALKAIDSWKCEMDDQLAIDDYPSFSPHVYYRNGMTEEEFQKAHAGHIAQRRS